MKTASPQYKNLILNIQIKAKQITIIYQNQVQLILNKNKISKFNPSILY